MQAESIIRKADVIPEEDDRLIVIGSEKAIREVFK